MRDGLTDGVNIVDIVEEDDVTLCVWVKFSEGRGALLEIQGPPFKDVHQREPFRGAEAGAAIMHNAISSNMFCCNLVHTTATQRKTQNKNGSTLHLIETNTEHLEQD